MSRGFACAPEIKWRTLQRGHVQLAARALEGLERQALQRRRECEEVHVRQHEQAAVAVVVLRLRGPCGRGGTSDTCSSAACFNSTTHGSTGRTLLPKRCLEARLCSE